MGAALTFNGFIKLTSLDGSNVQVERGNLGLSSPGVAADLTAIGFNQTERVTLDDAYSATGKVLTDQQLLGAKAIWSMVLKSTMPTLTL